MMKTPYRYIYILTFYIAQLMCATHLLANEAVNIQPEQIIFSNKWLSQNDIVKAPAKTSKHAIKKVALYKDTNLYFAAPLGKPLLAHLQTIAPQADDKFLLEKGNFRFEFIVNGTSVYIEDLNLGAVLPEQKRQDLVLARPFFSQINEDSWGRFLWMRFMRKAENTAFNTGLNTLTINLSTYIDGLDTIVAPIIASGSIVVDTTKPRASENDIAIQAIAPTSDWKLSSASYDRTKIKALNKQIAELRFKEINAIVVVKNGELLIEQYYNGSNRNTLHNPRSVGKTFASTVMGIAINEGYIKNEEQVLSDFYDLKSFKHYSPAKAKVTIKELLTMSSNFDANDFDSGSAGNEENMYPLDDWVKFALDLPMKESKQNISNWQYFTAGVVVLGDILHQKVPNGLEQYAHKTLFAPLAINNYQWQYTPTGVANTAGGLALRALDFAKFGQLYQNNGRWNNTQVVPQQWVKESLSKQVPRGQSPDEGHYGYLFWHDTFPIGNKMMNVAYATGNGGNKVFIFKDIDLVVVINASAYNRIYAHPQVNEMMANYILPAVLE